MGFTDDGLEGGGIVPIGFGAGAVTDAFAPVEGAVGAAVPLEEEWEGRGACASKDERMAPGRNVDEKKPRPTTGTKGALNDFTTSKRRIMPSALAV